MLKYLGSIIKSSYDESKSSGATEALVPKVKKEPLVDPMSVKNDNVFGKHFGKSKLENLLVNQAFTFENVYSKQAGFDTPKFHYDWWLFPVEAPKGQWSDTSDYYSIDPQETLALINNSEFTSRFIASTEMYMKAQLKSWNHYDVRFGKVLLSLMHFIGTTDHYPEYFEFNMRLRELATLAMKLASDSILPEYNSKKPNEPYPYDATHKMSEFLQTSTSQNMLEQLCQAHLLVYLEHINDYVDLYKQDSSDRDAFFSLKIIEPYLQKAISKRPDLPLLLDSHSFIKNVTSMGQKKY